MTDGLFNLLRAFFPGSTEDSVEIYLGSNIKNIRARLESAFGDGSPALVNSALIAVEAANKGEGRAIMRLRRGGHVTFVAESGSYIL